MLGMHRFGEIVNSRLQFPVSIVWCYLKSWWPMG